MGPCQLTAASRRGSDASVWEGRRSARTGLCLPLCNLPSPFPLPLAARAHDRQAHLLWQPEPPLPDRLLSSLSTHNRQLTLLTLSSCPSSASVSTRCCKVRDKFLSPDSQAPDFNLQILCVPFTFSDNQPSGSGFASRPSCYGGTVFTGGVSTTSSPHCAPSFVRPTAESSFPPLGSPDLPFFGRISVSRFVYKPWFSGKW